MFSRNFNFKSDLHKYTGISTKQNKIKRIYVPETSDGPNQGQRNRNDTDKIDVIRMVSGKKNGRKRKM